MDDVVSGSGTIIKSPKAPRVTWIFGLLGLIPFFAGGLATSISTGETRTRSQRALAAYSALILSFLGGGRWGLEIDRRPVRVPVIGASMLPTVTGFLLLLLPASKPRLTLGGLAAAMTAQWLWDVKATDTPQWYPGLRSVLTAGASAALLAGLVSAAREQSPR